MGVVIVIVIVVVIVMGGKQSQLLALALGLGWSLTKNLGKNKLNERYQFGVGVKGGSSKSPSLTLFLSFP